MKKFLSVIFIFNSALLFSIDCFSYVYAQNVTYAIAISPSQISKDEFIVGLLEIDPSGEERWTISTRAIVEDNIIKSKIDMSFPAILIKEDNSIDVQINRKNNVVLHLKSVNKIIYRDCEVEIPSVFFQ